MANKTDEPYSNGGEELSGAVKPEGTPPVSPEDAGKHSEADSPVSNDSADSDSSSETSPDSGSPNEEAVAGNSESPPHSESSSEDPKEFEDSTESHSQDTYHESHSKHEAAHLVDEPEDEEEGGGPVKSFLEHLEDLRWTFIKSGSSLAIGMIACLIAAPSITSALRRPLLISGIQTELQLLDPLGGFMITLKLAFYAGLVFAIPLILLFVGQFVVPALKRREKKYFLVAFSIGTVFFVSGIVMCYFLLLPFSLRALVRYNMWLGFGADMWRGEAYFEFASKFMLGVGLLCEIPVLILTLIRLEVIPHALLLKGRRYMFVVNFAICAMLTPVDMVTTFLMALALQLVYEVCIVISNYWEKQRKRRQAAEATA